MFKIIECDKLQSIFSALPYGKIKLEGLCKYFDLLEDVKEQLAGSFLKEQLKLLPYYLTLLSETFRTKHLFLFCIHVFRVYVSSLMPYTI